MPGPRGAHGGCTSNSCVSMGKLPSFSEPLLPNWTRGVILHLFKGVAVI